VQGTKRRSHSSSNRRSDFVIWLIVQGLTHNYIYVEWVEINGKILMLIVSKIT
jgi:hypothetical protein